MTGPTTGNPADGPQGPRPPQGPRDRDDAGETPSPAFIGTSSVPVGLSAVGYTMAATLHPHGPRGHQRPSPSPVLTRGELVGRYVVLALLGQGGMGAVYAAYDPELDRRVAIKVLRGEGEESEVSTTSDARTRLLREAQALAQLSHPNVVAVHDVGVLDGQVWLAMEYVEGVTLTAWLAERARGWREVVEVYRRAGEGLHAAHAAGLVHRDFKPDNVMVGHDGRVRVMDFGLARGGQALKEEVRPVDVSMSRSAGALTTEVTRAGTVLGTPPYMAPEQWLGIPADARSDQFSFCVALWQGLYGKRPFAGETIAEMVVNVTTGRRVEPTGKARVPAWLRRALDRGLAVLPDERWPSMAALLATLAGGTSKGRWWWALVGALCVGAVVGGLVGVRGWERGRRIDACVAEGASIRAVWNPEVAAGLRGELLAAGSGYAATASRQLERFLDDFTRTWSRTRTQACWHYQVDRVWDVVTAERAQSCLEAARWSLEGLLAALAEQGADGGRWAVQAAAGLPQLEPCLDVGWLAHGSQPPRDPSARAEVAAIRRRLAAVAAMHAAGRHDDAYAQAQAQVWRADAVGWTPLAAQARIVAGGAARRAANFGRAEQLLEEGMVVAVRAGDEALIADAEIGLTTIVGSLLARPEEGLRWGRLAEARLERLGQRGGPRDAALRGNIASVMQRSGDLEGAQRYGEQALAISERLLGTDHPELAGTLQNLASVHFLRGDPEGAGRLFARALTITERALGPEHVYVAGPLASLALVYNARGDRDEAVRLFERALVLRERAQGPEHRDLAGVLNNLAVVLQGRGEYLAAQRIYERSLAITERTLPPDHPDVARAMINLGNVYHHRRAHDAALRLFERGAAIEERVGDDEMLASALFGMANVHASRGQHALARPLLERALRLREAAHGPDAREVADTLHNLSEAFTGLGDYDQAQRLQERILAMYGRTLAADDPEFGYPFLGLGRIALTRGRPEEAVMWLERAVVATRSARAQPALRGEVHHWLARAVWASGKDPNRARALADEAIRLLAGDEYVLERGDVERWLAGLPTR